jgi:glycosidase
MDTLPHVPRSFWEKWASAIKREFPRVVILGELFDDDPALIAYFQTGRYGHDGIDTNIDTLFDFPLYFAIRNSFAQGKPIREVSKVFAHDWLYPNPEVLATFIGVHDTPRFMNENGATIEGLKLAQTLIMTSRGIPIIYYGDEIAMPGGADPDNRRDFPGGFPSDSRNAFTPEGRTAEENEVWNHLATLARLRRELEPLRRGRTMDLLEEEQQMAYARVTDEEAVLVVINNEQKPVHVSFDVSMIKPFGENAVLVDRLGKLKDIEIRNGLVDFEIPARTSAVFTLKSR